MPDNYYSEVNENGVVTPLRDLAAFPRSEQAVLGARNLFLFNNEMTAITLTGTVDNFNITSSGTWKSAAFTMPVEPNTKYRVKFDVEVASGICFSNAYDATNSVTLASGSTVTEDTADYTYEFTTGATTKSVRVSIFCTGGTSDTGDITVKKFEFVLASDTYNGYTLPAMTNRELTEKVQGIINAATNAADFAAFKTAIGNL